MGQPDIEPMLVISTAHVTKETADALPRGHIDMESPDDIPEWGPAFARNEGWLFYVGDVNHYETAPPELRACVQYARSLGCTWMMLDADGPVVGALESWEW